MRLLILFFLTFIDIAFPEREIEITTQHLQSPWITRVYRNLPNESKD